MALLLSRGEHKLPRCFRNTDQSCADIETLVHQPEKGRRSVSLTRSKTDPVLKNDDFFGLLNAQCKNGSVLE
eukprot:scaffold30796_cov43-Prasinocladus_malaysianus.AAC.1